jgi:hypothetical protein
MNSFFSLILFLSTLLFTACNSITVSHDFDPEADFSKLKTYYWRDADPKTDALVKNAIVQKRVITAIDSVLKLKGFELLKDSTKVADFAMVTFASIKEFTTITDNRTSSGVAVGVGVGGYGVSPNVINYGASGATNGGYAGGGYSGGGAGYYHSWYNPWYGSAVGVKVGGGGGHIEVSTEDEGTLFVDVVNLENKQLIWRGVGKKMLDQFAGMQEKITEINSLVGKIMENYPPEDLKK